MSEADGQALIEQWQASGLSVQDFCETRGIGTHRLRYWKARMEEKASGASFIVVSKDDFEQTSAPRNDRSDEDDAIEISVKGAYVVRIPRCTANLAEILRAMREAAE